MTGIRHIFSIVSIAFLISSVSVTAQEIPKMSADPAFRSGVLPNGINYYVVANADAKGMADFALVQKSGKTFEDRVQTMEISDRLMSSIPTIDSLSPRRFFIENGVVPRKGRFMWQNNGAAIFRFSEVPAIKAETVDSTLLVLMGMIRTSCDLEDEFSRRCYAPSENAIIVSGDVNADEIIGKMKMLSYMVPSRTAVERLPYIWKDKDPSFSIIPSSGRTAEISVSWTMPATPEAFVGTIQPVVHKQLIDELGYIVSGRIRHVLASKDIATADVRYVHLSSTETGADEEFRVSVIVGDSSALPAAAAVSEALSLLGKNGVSLAERENAHSAFMRKMFSLASRPVRPDKEYVDLCVNAFLFGSVPVSRTQLYDFYRSKNVSDTTSVAALNRMAFVMMRPDRNLTVQIRCASDISVDSLKTAFLSAWDDVSAADAAQEVPARDTLSGFAPDNNLAVTSVRKEHLSGGHLWTFGNGVRVAYKRMDTGGKMFWALGLNGGYGNIPDLCTGEGAFVGDLLRLGRIAGMSWEDFVHFLESREIYLDTKVGMSSTIISGVAPGTELPMVIRALAAIANERTSDDKVFEAYRRDEWLRLEKASGSSNVVVDSLMCPGYIYSGIKSQGKLSKVLLSKSDELFEDLFSKMNDGIIVLVGDQNEAIVRKQLRGYLGRFRTKDSVPVRPLISYQPTAGSMTHVTEGDRNAVYIAMSVPMTLTIGSHAVAEVAGMLLKKRISSSLVGSGMFAKVYWDTRIVPHERFNVLVVLEEVEGVHKEDAEETARRIVRDILSPEGLSEISESQVTVCRNWLEHVHELKLKNPGYWVDAMLLRYLDGKDFTSAYASSMNDVTADKVKNLLSNLAGASKVEYIIRKK